jgi:hypothetical protein
MVAASNYQEEWDGGDGPREALLARLSRAAYEVALREAGRVPFADLELAIWRELRGVFDTDPAALVLLPVAAAG